MATRTDERVLAGRYRLGEVLGRGAMGEVREAYDLRLRRSVAVKLLTPEMAHDESVRRRFQAEACAAARFDDHRIVRVYDSGVDEEHDVPFLVMEKVTGGTLADEVACGPLSVDRALAVGADVLGALSIAHGHGVVHRDVKPGNILVTESGAAKVADFGIAKSLRSGDMTQTGFVLGTVAYLPPERIEGAKASPQSDVYAMGVVLFEALTGRRPYDGATPIAVLDQVRSQPVPSTRDLRPEIPVAVDAVVRTALSKRLEDRYPSAEAMAGALAAAVRGEATVLVPAAGMAAATVALAAGAAAPAAGAWPRPPAAAATGRPVAQVGLRTILVGGAAALVALLLVAGVALATSGRPAPSRPIVSTEPPAATTVPAPPATTPVPAAPRSRGTDPKDDEGGKGKGKDGKGDGKRGEDGGDD